jgi:outer membrane receptor for monomeric catechols
MKRSLFLATLVGFLFLSCAIARAQVVKEHFLPRQPIGIPVSKKQFDSTISNAVITMREKYNGNANDMIKIARLYNTLEFDHMIDETKTNKEFIHLFDSKRYDILFIKKLDATERIGGSYYSKKYQIYLGGLPDNNSKYRIVKID